MLRNYFKIAIRNLLKNKIYFFLNVLGLAIGITCATLLLLYVQHERSYDTFHAKKDRIYRITESFKNGDSYTTTALTPYQIAPLLTASHPGVESFVRIDATLGWRQMEYGDKKFVERNITAVDSNFFEVFDFELLQGDAQNALIKPNAVVITDEIAKKYFGSDQPIGKVLTVRNIFNNSTIEAEVTGVMKTMPDNSHFHRDFLFSIKTAEQLAPNMIQSWGWTSQYSYVLLNEKTSVASVLPVLKEVTEKHAPEWFAQWAYMGLQPMSDIHLRSNLKDEIEAQGDITYVRIFTIIAFFILVIACINYMNLATARSTERAKEVGLRKVVGAAKRQLIIQFLSESVIIASVAFLIALFLFEFSLPYFQELSGKELEVQLVDNPWLIMALLGIALLVGLLSGSYPALVMTRFRPIQALKDQFEGFSSGAFLRKGLVVFQFSLSIMLIIGTITIYNQWDFLRNKKLGVNVDQVLTLPINSKKMLDNYELFKNELLQLPEVNGVTASNKSFASVFSSFDGFSVNGEKYTFPVVETDYDFFHTYEIPILEGRDFSKAHGADTASVIINQTAARQLGLEDRAVGTVLDFGNEEDPDPYQIIAVVQDFHYESLHKPINPVVFSLSRNRLSSLAINLNTSQLSGTIAAIRNTWDQFDFAGEFNFQFLNESIQRLYNKEAGFFKVFSIFSMLAIFIASLGLFGLASYTTQQRTKEIGIRKVLGATVLDVLYLLNKELARLLLIAFMIATPIAYYSLQQWLQGFAYSIEIGLGVFIFTALLVILVASLTVAYQSIKAAWGNPVKALKYE